MSTEYIFFDPALRDRFLSFVAERGLDSAVRPDPIEGFVVALADDLADDLAEALESEYAALEEEQRDLVEAADDESAQALMAVAVTLPDGSPCAVRLPADYARRLFATFSAEEVHDLVSIIAANVANPLSGPLCRKT
jgi:hypothetical protein